MAAGTRQTICLVLKTETTGCQEIQVILHPGDSASHSDTYANKGMGLSPLLRQGSKMHSLISTACRNMQHYLSTVPLLLSQQPLITSKGERFSKHLLETVHQEVPITLSTKASISVAALSELRAGIPLKMWLSVVASGLPGDFVHPFHCLWNQSPDGQIPEGMQDLFYFKQEFDTGCYL